MEYAQKQAEKHERDQTQPDQQKTEPREKDEDLAEDIDGILDEIDEVLEINAEQFVRSFVQKGGELCRRNAHVVG